VAGESKISTVGLGYGLNYRGYNIVDLANHSTFEEVLYLLLFERMPTKNELDSFVKKIASMRDIPAPLAEVLERIPKDAHPMDVMRCISSFLGTLEPEGPKHDQISIAVRLIAVFGPCLLYWYHFHKDGKRIKGSTGPTDSVALNFMKLFL